MSRTVKVSQDNYRLITREGGTITLDTGEATGLVVITGNLFVQGTQTTLNTTNLDIEDTIIRLNIGEAGVGITGGISGLEIHRGVLPDARFLFDENITHYDPVTETNINGSFIVQTTDGALSSLQLASIGTSPTTNLVFDMQNGSGILTVANTTGYESRVLADNDIPNKKYLDNYVASGIVIPGMADVDRIYFALSGVEKTRVQALSTFIQFSVNTVQRMQITTAGVDIDNINAFGNTITNKTSNNLILTPTSNNVEVNAILNLDDQASSPTATGGKTKIFSKSVAGPGKTGLFIANNTTSDELVAKNRALLFSMVF